MIGETAVHNVRIGCRSEAKAQKRLTWLALATGILALCGASVLFVIRVNQGMRLFEYEDEIEQFVIARAVNHGRLLYRDIFSQHGPVPYMVAHLYASLVSETDFSYVRMFQAALALLSCAAVAFSGVLKTCSGRIWAAALYLLYLSIFWNLEHLHGVTHYKISGFMFVVVISQCLAPAILGEKLTRYGLVAAGAAAALAFFSAFSGVLALLCFFSLSFVCIASFQRETLALAVSAVSLGAGIAMAGVLLWLAEFGDIVGYIVYHFYFNQEIYRKYIGLTVGSVLSNVSLNFERPWLVRDVAISCLVCWLYLFATLRGVSSLRGTWPTRVCTLVVVLIGVLLTNLRGYPNLGDSGFVVGNFALFSLAVVMAVENTPRGSATLTFVKPILLSAAILILAVRVSSYAITFFGVPQQDLERYVGTFKPGQEPIYQFIRSITRQDGDLIALPDDAVIYFKANRLPATGNLFYHPWQAEYNRRPDAWHKIDPCSDIRSHRPAVIWFLNTPAYEEATVDAYEPCVVESIVQGYTPLSFDSPWHIRNDLFSAHAANAPLEIPRQLDFAGNGLWRSDQRIMERSRELGPSSPILINMTAAHRLRQVGLRRLGIMFTTYDGKASGQAALRLNGPGGAEIKQRFSLEELSNNQYQYFNIDSKQYTQGRIEFLGGEGISTWESHWNNSVYSCAIYEYVDGSRGYTLGCPIM